ATAPPARRRAPGTCGRARRGGSSPRHGSGARCACGAITLRMAKSSSGRTVLNVEQSLDRAIEAHQNGELPEAERLYLQILAAEPDHFDAQHLLGVIRQQQG